MGMPALDTHQCIKEIKNAGFNDKQAEAFLHVVQSAWMVSEDRRQIEMNERDLVSVPDLKRTELELTLAIEKVRSDLTLEIEQVRFSLEQVRSDLSRDIAQVRSDLTLEIEKVRVDLEKVKSHLVFWVVGLFFAQTTFIFGFFGKAMHLF